jgi:hypothetical protein
LPDTSYRKVRAFAVLLCFLLASPTICAAACHLTNAQQDAWVAQRVNALVRAARVAFDNEDAKDRYQRVVDGIDVTIKRCLLSDDANFLRRYPEFVEYVRLLALAGREDHELGFEVSDEEYFAETGQYTTLPDFLLTPEFLRAVSRFENLPKAKALLREMNLHRAAGEQLTFFSYTSRHLGTPDNQNSYRRLLIVVPGDPARSVPEKWVQFGIADPRRPASVRNVSVVAVVPGAGQTSTAYFKDFYRTYHRDGSITIKGRWEIGEGDDACVECHKSGVLPIFPVAGSVNREEQPLVDMLNERFLTYGPARFGRYIDTSKFGPGLGSKRPGGEFLRRTLKSDSANFESEACTSCHHRDGLGSLNWPMDSTLISSFIEGGRMPLGSELRISQRRQLYNRLIQDYFAIDNERPGILKAWLLGKMRNGSTGG